MLRKICLQLYIMFLFSKLHFSGRKGESNLCCSVFGEEN